MERPWVLGVVCRSAVPQRGGEPEEGVEPEEAALWYFANYDDWQDWIAEDDVLERVIDALEEQGVDA